MATSPDTSSALTAVPWRVQAAIYGTGLFANSSLQLYNVIVPLWLVLLNASPVLIGVALGARHVLPMLFSIHGGALMDRLGARRVTLWLAGTSVCIPMLYPLLPWVSPLIILQMLGGFTVMMCWVGVQSFVGHAMRGQPVYAGRLTLSTRLGGFMGPPAVGAIWDLAGPWGAFGFMTFWAVGMFVAALCLPPGESVEYATKETTLRRTGFGGLMPDFRDYKAAFSLLAVPTIALVMGITMMRHAGTGIQGSFYVVYLKEIGITGTAIGSLFSIIGICGAAGSLCVEFVARYIAARTLLLAVVALSVLSVAISPLLGTFLTLAIAIGFRGVSTGIAQAMEISKTSLSVGAGTQGKAVALRLTIGRIAAVAVPVLMGAAVELFGLEPAFYIVGGVIIAGIFVLAMLLPVENP
jgi:MFS family permease